MREHNHLLVCFALFSPGGFSVVRHKQVENRAVHAGRMSLFFVLFWEYELWVSCEEGGDDARLKQMQIKDDSNTRALLLYRYMNPRFCDFFHE